MTACRLLCAFIVTACLAAPAAAQTGTQKPASLEARITALEKDNAQLRADVARLQQLLTRTRYEMIGGQGALLSSTSGLAAQSSGALIQPQSLASQQAQANAAIQSQGIGQQLNSLQLQQNMMQDRQREQQLFQPQTYGPQP